MKYFLPCLTIVVMAIGSVSLPTLADSNKFELKDFQFWYSQCLALSQEKQYTQALPACEQAISLKPKSRNIELWSARGDALYHVGKYVESLSSYNKVLTNAPKNSLAIATQCAALFQLDRYDDAVDTCEKALQINGNWGNTSPSFAWLYRGLALRKLGHLDTALDSYNRAGSRNDGFFVKAEKCSLIAEMKPFNQEKDCGLRDAVANYERAVSADASNPKIWIQQGLALEQTGFYDQALLSYDQALKLNPLTAFAEVRRCGVLNALEDYKTALESCDRALKSERQWDDFTSAYIWTQRSAALVGLGKSEDALTASDRALEIKPNYPPALTNKAVSLWQLKRYLQSRDVIKLAVKSYEEQSNIHETFTRKYPDPPAILYRGWVLAKYNYGRILNSTIFAAQPTTISQAYKDALDTAKKYQQVLGLKPEETETLSSFDKRILADINTNLAAVYIASNTDALTVTNIAINLNPKSFTGWYNRGLALAKNQQYSEALEAYQNAELLSPNNIYVLKAKGMALQNLATYGEAIEIFDKVLEVEPNNTSILAAKGTALEKLTRIQEAIAVYEKILKTPPRPSAPPPHPSALKIKP